MTTVDDPELTDWWVLTVAVETYAGNSAYGAQYNAPVDLPCWLERNTRLVRVPDGTEQISSTTLTAPLSAKDTLTVGSRVTDPDGAVSTVLTRTVYDDAGALGLPVHVSAALT